jgi:hypothetical protein
MLYSTKSVYVKHRSSKILTSNKIRSIQLLQIYTNMTIQWGKKSVKELFIIIYLALAELLSWLVQNDILYASPKVR